MPFLLQKWLMKSKNVDPNVILWYVFNYNIRPISNNISVHEQIQILFIQLGLNINIINVVCLRNLPNGGFCPIKVKLSSSNDVLTVLKSKSKLSNLDCLHKVAITKDFTIAQRT